MGLYYLYRGTDRAGSYPIVTDQRLPRSADGVEIKLLGVYLSGGDAIEASRAVEATNDPSAA